MEFKKNELKESGMTVEDSTSALWMLQMGQPTKTMQDPCGKRWYFTDNYYTCHVLANGLKQFTSGEAHLIGTIKFNNANGINPPGLKEAYTKLRNAPHGSWCLVRAYNTTKEVERRCRVEKASFFSTCQLHRQGRLLYCLQGQ